MKKSVKLSFMDKYKELFIKVLFGITILIMFSGLYYSFFSIINNINIKVLNTSVHGVVFGLLVFYLGIRYFLSLNKLKTEVALETSKFSWQNFKKIKRKKV